MKCYWCLGEYLQEIKRTHPKEVVDRQGLMAGIAGIKDAVTASAHGQPICIDHFIKEWFIWPLEISK